MLTAQAIIAAFFGLLFGNYATTFYHRLPLNKPINGFSDRKGIRPHCSKCKHPLKFYEYYPVIGWIYTRFKCRHCGFKIDMKYFYLEISCMIGAFIIWLFIGLNYKFVIALAILVPAILSIFLFLKTKVIYYRLLFVIIAAGTIICFEYV